MTKNIIQQRRRRHYQFSSQLAQVDNGRLRSLLETGEAGAGWGRNHTLDLGGGKVFVKRLPVTDLEHDNLFSTRNLYNLPTYYNYGVGSVGFGVYRELVAHIKTTNWVLDGQIEAFPLLYHYRIVPFSGERASVDMTRHQGYVDYWGGNENIGRYMLDRACANHEMLLFLEHMPHVLQPWLQDNPGRVRRVLNELRATIDFLRGHGIVHFDAHFHNILTDGERLYLTDFGLVLDRSFDLSENEQAFFKAHTLYDYGQVLSCLGALIYHAFDALPENDKRRIMAKYGMEKGIQDYALETMLIKNLEAIHADGVLKLNRNVVTCLAQYQGAVALMHDFYSNLSSNDKKDTEFRHAELRRQLKATRFI